jgi:hypothetical protein
LRSAFAFALAASGCHAPILEAFASLLAPELRGDDALVDGAEELHGRIAAMAERCGEDVHLYLKFQGD